MQWWFKLCLLLLPVPVTLAQLAPTGDAREGLPILFHITHGGGVGAAGLSWDIPHGQWRAYDGRGMQHSLPRIIAPRGV